MLNNKQYQLIILARSKPSSLEIRCGFTLLQYFKSNIEFVPVSSIHMPDTRVVRYNQLWEIKDIKGNSKNTIHHNLSEAKNQSSNVVITLYSTKMSPKTAIGRIKHELSYNKSIKRCLLVTKSEKVVKIK